MSDQAKSYAGHSHAAKIIEAVDIVQEIAKHVGLKPYKQEFSGLCPFHQEKTPSLILNDELGVYHCFGCGASGNIYTLNKRLSSKYKIRENYKSKKAETSKLDKKFEYHIPYRKIDFFNLTTSQSLWSLQISWTFFMENLQPSQTCGHLEWCCGKSTVTGCNPIMATATRK